MARDGFVGVDNLHLAKMIDTDKLTYETPVHIEGLVEIKAERSVSDDASYADDQPWITAHSDTGGTGTLSIRDPNITQEVRNLLAELSGYLITSEGDLLATDRPPVPCAVMCQQTGYIHGRKKLFYWAELGKPDFDATTKEDKVTVGQIDFPFTFKPVTLADDVRATTRDSFYGSTTYATFFEKVVTTSAEKTSTGA